MFAGIAQRFHELHRERYSYALERTPVEYLHWRIRGIGLIEQPPISWFDAVDAFDGHELAAGSRAAWFPGAGGFVTVATYATDALPSGAELRGPAIVDGATTTIVVEPGQTLLADGRQGYLPRIR